MTVTNVMILFLNIPDINVDRTYSLSSIVFLPFIFISNIHMIVFILFIVLYITYS